MNEYIDRVRAAASEYYDAGWHVTVVPYRSKSKRDRTFLTRRHESKDALLQQLEEAKNIGVSLGFMSNNLFDVDVDDSELVPYVDAFFPETRVFGRPSARRTHRIGYTKDGPLKSQQITMPGHGTLIELRGSNNHTIFPPSHHKDTGEAIEWEDTNVPIVALTRAEVLEYTRRAAAAAVIARYYVEGSWHFLTRDLAGWFARNDLDREFTRTFLHTIESQIFKARDFRDVDNVIDSSYDKLENGQEDEVTGYPSLAEHIDERVLKTIAKWLHIQESDAVNADLAVTDAHNVERLIARYGDRIRYCPEWKSWYVWDGKRWKIDIGGGTVRRYIGECARVIYTEAASAPTQQERNELGRWARMSEMWPRIDACYKLATSHERLQVEPRDFDSDRTLLNTQNGVVNLKSGEVLAHSPDYMMTKITDCPVNRATSTPVFDLLLDTIFVGNKDMIAFMQRALGASLLGYPGKFFFPCFGETNRGKTTILTQVFQRMLGDYSRTIVPDAVAMRRQREAVLWMADLVGIRYAVLSELPRSFEIDVSLIKAMTGGNTQTGKRLYEMPFEFEPSATFWIDTNHLPRIGDNDPALWGRMKPVNFRGEVKKERGDPGYVENVEERLEREFPGVLAWAIDGCLDYLEQGLNDPPEVLRATEKYRKEEDPIEEFIADTLYVDENAFAPATDVKNAIKHWKRDSNVKDLKINDITDALEDRGFKRERRKRNGKYIWYWFGFSLDGSTSDDREPVDAEEELTLTPFTED